MIQVQKSYHHNEKKIGELYLVPTPIGNLEDMTFRAINILKEVDLILAEDTRNSGQLLKHFDISTPMQSFHDFSTEVQVEKYVQRLDEGESMALISDAGMPLINDPGHPLVLKALELDIPIISLPGANAALTALIASGLTSDRFTYYGFFPRKKQEQVKLLAELSQNKGTAIFYESPHRIIKTVECIVEQLSPEVEIVIARELTKKFEEYIRGTAEEVCDMIKKNPIKGEIVLLIEGQSKHQEINLDISDEDLKNAVENIVTTDDVSPMTAIKTVAKEFQLKKQRVYDAYHK